MKEKRNKNKCKKGKMQKGKDKREMRNKLRTKEKNK